MPKGGQKVARGGQFFYWQCGCMKNGEGIMFETTKRRDMWKRLHLSKCEFKDYDDIKLKSLGNSKYETEYNTTEHTIRANIKAANAMLN